MVDEDRPSETSDAATTPDKAIVNRVFLVIVDDSQEMKVALRFASRRARHTDGRVALLYVIEPTEYQHFMGVGDLIREETRGRAEQHLQRIAGTVKDLSGKFPVVYLREGNRREELMKLIDEEPEISILVLAAGTEANSPGPLIAALTGRYLGRLKIPLTIVPGNLDGEAIDAIS